MKRPLLFLCCFLMHSLIRTASYSNIDSGIEIEQIVINQESAIESLTFLPDGKTLYWRLQNGAEYSKTPLDEIKQSMPPRDRLYRLKTHIFAFSPKFVAEAFLSKRIEIASSKTAEMLCCLIGHTENVTALAVSPCGKLLASGSIDNTIRIWDLGPILTHIAHSGS